MKFFGNLVMCYNKYMPYDYKFVIMCYNINHMITNPFTNTSKEGVCAYF